MREWRFLIKRHPTSDERFEVQERLPDGHRWLLARTAFGPGETLVGFCAGVTLAEPSTHTVQVSASRHILLEPKFLEYTNHSCSPNVILDVDRMQVTAISPILAGDEIVYFYPSTETSMSRPFTCHCASAECLGWIQGADYLPSGILDRYHLSNHVRSLLLLRQMAS